VNIEQTPHGFRRAQRRIAEHAQLSGWRAAIPESYAEEPSSSRADDDVVLRTWNSDSVGTTRLPAGLLRFYEDAPRPPDDAPDTVDDWEAVSRYMSLWPDGTGNFTLVFRLGRSRNPPMSELSKEINSRREALTAQALTVSQDLVSGVVRALEAAGCDFQLNGPLAVRLVGRHRLVRFTAKPTDSLLGEVRRDLVLVGSASEFANISGDASRFYYAGSGVSVEIAPDLEARASQLSPILEYYEYWIAATTAIDDQLYGEFVRLSRSAVPSDYNGDSIKNAARELFFAHEDVLSAMSPAHAAIWKSLMPTWRVPELEQNIREKIQAVEEVNRGLREKLSNREPARTSLVVTFLTALTLISIVTGVAAFVLFPENRLSEPMRVWLSIVSCLVALMLFLLTVRPVLLARTVRGGQLWGGRFR
jgi:hypothetical protein